MRLIDADELLRRYDETHVGKPGNARKLIKEAPTVDGWIRITHGKPPVGEELIVARKYAAPGKKEVPYVEVAELQYDGTWYSNNDEYKIHKQFHTQPYAWMPKPKAPKYDH